jgi:hypothetical protein
MNIEQFTKADRLRVSRPLQNRAKRAHESPQVTNNGKARRVVSIEQIKGLSNVFVHEYFGVDTNIVWEILKGDIPDLKVRISEILNSLD